MMTLMRSQNNKTSLASDSLANIFTICRPNVIVALPTVVLKNTNQYWSACVCTLTGYTLMLFTYCNDCAYSVSDIPITTI